MALKRASHYEGMHRKAVKDAFKRSLDDGALFMQKTVTKLPGGAAFRMLRGPSGWSKAKEGPSRYNSLTVPDEADSDDEFAPEPPSIMNGNADGEPVLLADQGEVEATADSWAKLWSEGSVPFVPPDGNLENFYLS